MRGAASVWLVLFGAMAFAQEPAPANPAKSSPPPSEDAIAAAKRDFNALKAPRGPLDQPGVTMPSLSTPELQLGSSLPPTSASATPDKTRTKKKSANWLVDAMEKPNDKDARDPRSKNTGVATRGRRDPDAFDPLAGKDDDLDAPAGTNATADKPTAAILEKRSGSEFNPLASYMSGWMSPQDYALLKPGLNAPASGDLTNRGAAPVPTLGSNVGTLGDATATLDFARANNKPTSLALPKPEDNPFLQSSNVNGGQVTAIAPPVAPNPPPAGALRATPPPMDVAPARSKIPDFVKPANDEKYFKQLKRF